MIRAMLRFELVHGAGTISGDDHDTVETLLAVLLEKWPSELIGAWSGSVRVYP